MALPGGAAADYGPGYSIMGYSAGSDAGAFVAERMSEAKSQSLAAQNAAFAAIGDMVSLAAQAGGIDIPTLLTLNPTPLPTDPPYLSLLTYGESGIPADVEQAIFDRASERNEDLRRAEHARADARWATAGFSLPNGMLASIHAGIDNEFNDARTDLNREVMIKSFDVAADFAKALLQAVNQWSMELIRAGVSEQTADAELRLKQAEVVNTLYTEKVRILLAAVQAEGNLAVQLVSSLWSGISVSASVSEGHSRSESTSVSDNHSSSDNVQESTEMSHSAKTVDGETGNSSEVSDSSKFSSSHG